MPFFSREPFKNAAATYTWAGANQPGFFRVIVRGDAPKFSGGFELRRDPDFVGALGVEVLGWTGPIAGPGQSVTYTVSGQFIGAFQPEIVVIGSNMISVVRVEEFPFTSDEAFAQRLSAT